MELGQCPIVVPRSLPPLAQINGTYCAYLSEPSCLGGYRQDPSRVHSAKDRDETVATKRPLVSKAVFHGGPFGGNPSPLHIPEGLHFLQPPQYESVIKPRPKTPAINLSRVPPPHSFCIHSRHIIQLLPRPGRRPLRDYGFPFPKPRHFGFIPSMPRATPSISSHPPPPVSPDLFTQVRIHTMG